MNLVKRGTRAARPLARLRDEMDDLFRGFFDDWDLGRPGAHFADTGWWPSMDISENEDDIMVKVELPGVKKEDVDISVQDNTLTISGEKKHESEDNGEGCYHTERRYGSFRRDIRLPSGVDMDKIEAVYRDGVLALKMPKSEQAKPKRIEVK